MQDREIDRISEKIKIFMQGTSWGQITIYFREGKIQKYEQVKTELPEDRSEINKKTLDKSKKIV